MVIPATLIPAVLSRTIIFPGSILGPYSIASMIVLWLGAILAHGRTRISCVKCGKCVDQCPTGAISYHIKGTRPHWKPARARMLFLYPSYLFLTVFGGSMAQDGLYRILLLVTTGSMIR